MFTLNRKLWHTQLFFFAVMCWEKFKGGENEWRYEDKTNLCHYIRTIVVWMPLVVFFHLLLVMSFIYVFFILPAKLSGLGDFYSFIGIVAGVIGLITGIVFAYLFIRNIMYERKGTKRVKDVQKKEEKIGFIRLSFEYIVAQKKKICPLIEFTGKEN